MASAHERVVRIINTTTGSKLNADDVGISNVVVNTNKQIDRNTKCQLTATVNGRLSGAGPFYYNRLDLAKMFFGQNPTVEVPLGSRLTTQDLAMLVAEKYRVDIQREDIVASTSYLVNSFPFDLEIEAVEGSYCVTGKIMCRAIQTGAPIEEAMGGRTLSGINPPNGNLSKWQGVFYSWNWVAQVQLYELMLAAYQGDRIVPAEALPYIQQLAGDDPWVYDEVVVNDFNLGGAKVTYIGNRDDHPLYASSSHSNEIIVISLSEVCDVVGGDLVITI